MAPSFPGVLIALSAVYYQMMRPTHSNSRFFWLGHKVGRVLSFSPVVGIGTPPTPHPQASVPASPPPRFRGEGHTCWRERGVGESQFRRGDRHCGILYLCVLCGLGVKILYI
jgi:hypothetical protein